MVAVTLQGPAWFFGVDAMLEAIVALIAFFVTVASFRVYRLTKEAKYGWFTASFALLTLSFLSRAITDTIVEELLFACPKNYLPHIFYFGYLTHIILALAAFLMLFVVTHRVQDKRVIALLALTTFPSLVLSSSYFLSFYGLSFILLTMVSIAYYQNYRKVKSLPSGIVFVSFFLFTLAQAFFLLSAFNPSLYSFLVEYFLRKLINEWWYVAAQASQALSFILLLFALLSIRMKFRK